LLAVLADPAVAQTDPTAQEPCRTLFASLLDPAIDARLAAGGIEIREIDDLETERTAKLEKVHAGLALANIDASLEEVIAVLADDKNFGEVFPYVAEVKSREVGEDTVVYQYIDLPFPIRNLWYEVLVKRQRQTTDKGQCFESRWSYIEGSGNIEDTRGRWELFEPEGGGRTTVAYFAWAQAGGMVPAWAQNWASKRALPKVIEALRAEVARRRLLARRPAGPATRAGG
jgi:hypothetical protein